MQFDPMDYPYASRRMVTYGARGMVATSQQLAAQAGLQILREGGNAVDAAVATGFALAVTYPRAGNIGGGGFMIIHLAQPKKNIAIDYREVAPAAIRARESEVGRCRRFPARGGSCLGSATSLRTLSIARRTLPPCNRSCRRAAFLT